MKPYFQEWFVWTMGMILTVAITSHCRIADLQERLEVVERGVVIE